MNKTLAILVIVITISGKNVNAQYIAVPDTLAHLQTIVANKAFYIGKPFSVLGDSLKIQIKFFSPFASIHYAIAKETSTFFGFYFPQNEEEMYLTYPGLEIDWQPYLNATQSRIHYTANNGGGWSNVMADYYSKGMISDIRILE
jgi:hypothetical protein